MGSFKISAAAATLLLVVGCKTTPSATANAPDCRPSNLQAQLSCWWPGEGLTLTQCQVQSESPAGCGFGERALRAYENVQSLPLSNSQHPNGTWAAFAVYQDETGHVGVGQTDRNGRVSLLIVPAKNPQTSD